MSLLFHKKTPRITRITQIFFIFVLISEICGVVYAERKTDYGFGIDFMAGMSNQARTSSLSNQDFRPFYAVYPSVTLSSEGRHSILDLNYTFGAGHYRFIDPITATSHSFSLIFDAQTSGRTRFRLSNRFNNAPNYSTLNVLKGVNLTQEGFEYIFEPEVYERNYISNSARGEFEVELSPQSSLTFTGGGSVRRYDASVTSSYLNNQFRIEGGLAYSRRSSERQTWKFQYNVRQNEYSDYDPSRTHSATVRFAHRLTPNTNLALDAGPSYTEERDTVESYVSYDVSARFSYKFTVNVFSAGYSHRPGDSTGWRTATDSHQGYLGFSRTFGRWTSLRMQASAFKQSQRDSDLHDYWGARGSIALARQLGRHWVVTGGVSYGEHERYDSKSIYVSIGYKNATNYKN